MISIKKHTTKFEVDYCDKIWNRIWKKVNKELYDFANVFPEALVRGAINKTFFYDIIRLFVDDARNKYDSIDLYYSLTYICCYDLQKNMKGNFPKCEYKNIRFSWYQKINKSTVISSNSAIYMYKHSLNEKIICNSDNEWKKYVANIRPIYKRLYECVGKIFNYEEDLDSEMKADLVKDLEISVCPYCNRQYINFFIEGTRRRTIADIDHFLPKEYYTLWSDSLYNLIPSCKVCNTLFKWKRNINMFNPYQRGYDDDAYFSVGYVNKLSLSDLLGWSNKDIKIELKISGDAEVNKKIEAESKLFRIEEVYDIHSSYVKNLLYKRAMIEKTILEEMVAQVNIKTGENVITIDDVRNVLYGMSLDNVDYNNIPLSKLTYDLLNKG